MHRLRNLPLVTFMATSILQFPKLTRADTTFDLWAYGSTDGVGVSSFFHSNGNIVLCNNTANPDLVPVYVSKTDAITGRWTIYKNGSDSSGSPEVLGLLGLPNERELNQVVAISEANSTYRLGDFRLYGNFAFAKEDGTWTTLFYAENTDVPGVWNLVWNPQNVNDASVEPIVVRNLSPL